MTDNPMFKGGVFFSGNSHHSIDNKDHRYFDGNGNQLWAHKLCDSSTGARYGEVVNGYHFNPDTLELQTHYVYAFNKNGIFKIRVDDGHIMWNTPWLSGTEAAMGFLDVDPEGNLYVTCQSMEKNNYICMAKIGSNGAILWEGSFGTRWGFMPWYGYYPRTPWVISVFPGKVTEGMGGRHFYVCGQTATHYNDGEGNVEFDDGLDAGVVKYDHQGNIIWRREYDTPGGHPIRHIIATRDPNVVYAASDSDYHRLNANGDILWTKNLPVSHSRHLHIDAQNCLYVKWSVDSIYERDRLSRISPSGGFLFTRYCGPIPAYRCRYDTGFQYPGNANMGFVPGHNSVFAVGAFGEGATWGWGQYTSGVNKYPLTFNEPESQDIILNRASTYPTPVIFHGSHGVIESPSSDVRVYSLSPDREPTTPKIAIPEVLGDTLKSAYPFVGMIIAFTANLTPTDRLHFKLSSALETVDSQITPEKFGYSMDGGGKWIKFPVNGIPAVNPYGIIVRVNIAVTPATTARLTPYIKVMAGFDDGHEKWWDLEFTERSDWWQIGLGDEETAEEWDTIFKHEVEGAE